MIAIERDTSLSLKAQLLGSVAVAGPMWRYVDALATLRSALFDYFAEQGASLS